MFFVTINYMKNSTKTYILTTIAILSTILIGLFVQLNAGKSIPKCSYLDPIIIDLLAFAVGLFLVIEGLIMINKNISEQTKVHLTRITRVAFGCAILTIHIIQFLHK